MKYFLPTLSGLLFSFGLSISGMTEPQNILAFLDITGDWNPNLMFVMVGAIGVYSIMFPVVSKKKKPIFDSQFHLPTANKIDKKLLVGATLFGTGWGVTGLCPGPGWVGLVSSTPYSVIFFITMLSGMVLSRSQWLNKIFSA